MERSKKKGHPCKKASIHFLLCFVMGFFIGLAPTRFNKPPASIAAVVTRKNQFYLAPNPTEALQNVATTPQSTLGLQQEREKQMGNLNRSLGETTSLSRQSPEELSDDKEQTDRTQPIKQLIIVTPTSARDGVMREVLLRRTANTLKLVKPPLLWIVVESQLETSNVSHILRRTGVMYRHLVFKENFTDAEAEMNHQRNLALSHIEHHRLSGVVHFAGLFNAYDLAFFDAIRATEVLGTWPLAKLRNSRKKVGIEGPVCHSSQVVGWHLKSKDISETKELPIHISSFGFNSSILWDPERWGRVPLTQHSKPVSLKFVKEALIDEESKLKGIPEEDCSKINVWHFRL